MRKKPIRTVSKVQSRSAETDGIFVEELTPLNTPQELVDLLRSFPSNKDAVMDRIEYMEEVALSALRKCGIDDYNENALMIEGKRYTDAIPDDFWAASTTSERLNEILKDLGVKGKQGLFGKARSVQKSLSLCDFANRLLSHCSIVRDKIKDQDFWGAVHRMSIAEQSLSNVIMSLMEQDYVRGKRQRASAKDDWDIILPDWRKERPKHKNDAQCDRAIAAKYGINFQGTVRSQRRNKGVS